MRHGPIPRPRGRTLCHAPPLSYCHSAHMVVGPYTAREINFLEAIAANMALKWAKNFFPTNAEVVLIRKITATICAFVKERSLKPQ